MTDAGDLSRRAVLAAGSLGAGALGVAALAATPSADARCSLNGHPPFPT